jgi:uncharacterized protein (TIGR03067 family)
MRHFSIILLVCLILVGCTGTKNAKSTAFMLDGTWVPVKEEIAGQVLPPAAFASQKLVLAGKTYTMTAESIDKGEATYADGKMDVYGKEGVNTGKHFMAIYKLENEELTICYNLVGDSYPTDFETKSKPMLFMAVFKKDVGK